MNFKKHQCVRIKRDVTNEMLGSAILPRYFRGTKLYFIGVSNSGRAKVSLRASGSPWYVPAEYLEPYESPCMFDGVT